MKKKNQHFATDFHVLARKELHLLRGGKFSRGPGDLVEDDIDMPDLVNAPGPGDLVEDDIDMPDLTYGFIRQLKQFKFANNMPQIL